MSFSEPQAIPAASYLINRRHRMNLPDAPIAHEGFFATHFFTVRDQEKSRDFYVLILGGNMIRAGKIPVTSNWPIAGSSSTREVAPLPTNPRCFSRHHRISTE
jgi:hypothetical protein